MKFIDLIQLAHKLYLTIKWYIENLLLLCNLADRVLLYDRHQVLEGGCSWSSTNGLTPLAIMVSGDMYVQQGGEKLKQGKLP